MINRSRLWWMLLLIALSVWGLTDVRRRGYSYPNSPADHKTDFTVYTEAGAAFFDGREPYLVANPRGWTYLYPPLFAMMLAPLHALPSQDQVTVWFFSCLLIAWGCYRECRRIVGLVCDEHPSIAAAWKTWLPWLVVAAVAAATIPTLNSLQRGQLGVVKLYLLLLGLRIILNGRSYRAWLIGGVVLALPVAIKIVPALPVGFLAFYMLAESVWSWIKSKKSPKAVSPAIAASRNDQSPALPPVGLRFVSSSVGVAFGLVLFFLLIPAALVGWRANLHHLDTWGRFMLTKADNGGMDPRSGNSHSVRNQSLQNGAYRLGNFISHVFGQGPDDRWAEQFDAPPMAMDLPSADRYLFLSRALIGLTLLAVGARLARHPGNRLNMATAFALSCVTMLSISPVGRAHYFMFLSPAILFVPLWLDLHGRRRAGLIMAATVTLLPILHYAALPIAGRLGLLGLGTTAWLLAALALIAHVDRATACSERERDAANPDVRETFVRAA